MEQEAVYGKKCLELFAKLDLNTLSLKTVQCSLIEDLTPLSLTLPKSGMYLNGNVYLLRNLGLTISESGFMELPTPSKCDALVIMKSLSAFKKYYQKKHQDRTVYQCQLNGLTAHQTMNYYELMMGFPENWTKIE